MFLISISLRVAECLKSLLLYGQNREAEEELLPSGHKDSELYTHHITPHPTHTCTHALPVNVMWQIEIIDSHSKCRKSFAHNGTGSVWVSWEVGITWGTRLVASVLFGGRKLSFSYNNDSLSRYSATLRPKNSILQQSFKTEEASWWELNLLQKPTQSSCPPRNCLREDNLYDWEPT